MAESHWSVRRTMDHQALVGAMATTVIGVVIVTALYLGQDIFVPLALSILLSFVLAPLTRAIQRAKIPRSIAVISVVLLAFAVLFGLGTVMGTQLAQLAGDLPRYETTIRDKVKALRGVSAGDGTLERAADMLQDLGKELDSSAETKPGESRASAPVRPIPVIVSAPQPGPIETIAALIAPLLHPLATTGLIIIFVIFILIQREDLRNRIIRLAGTNDIQRTTAALDDAASRLSRLFLVQLAINSGFGLVIGLGLWAIGVPSALLWGILAAVLRFVPYIGAIIAAAFPLALAAAVDPGWSMLLWTGLLFLIVEPIVGHFIEPIFHGHTTGLSPVAVVLSATFWTMLWGPIGLVLATPLTVCLVVLGRHIERLSFLDILLGDQPALQPWELFYQRMLAGDASEAVEQAEEVLKERRLADYYDGIALRGLRLAQDDIAAGALDLDRAGTIRGAVQELVADLTEYDDRNPSTGDDALQPEAAAAVEATPADRNGGVPFVDAADLTGRWASPNPVMCIAGKSPVDEAAAILLADLLSKHGLRATAHGVEALTSSNIFRLDLEEVALVVLCCLDASSPAHIRNLARRIRRKAPHVRIMIALWGAEPASAEAVRASARGDVAATDLRRCLALAIGLATGEKTEVKQPTSIAAVPIR
jgi:predicted PurR-regulated permease PerM